MSRVPAPEEAQRAVEEAAADARDEDFWEHASGLTAIRGWARARRVSPDAVLAEVLAGVAVRTPPTVQLPPPPGAGSLNGLVALVGPSSIGKGGAQSVGLVAADWPTPIVILPLGTGEGVAAAFVSSRPLKGGGHEVQWLRWGALLVCREVDKLGALKGRQGSTVTSELRQAWSGEELGSMNADASRRLLVPRHAYRAVLTLGVQPGRGAILLDDADGGLPQRVWWVSARDPDIPDLRPDDPPRIKWTSPAEVRVEADELAMRSPDAVLDRAPLVLPVCDLASGEIDRALVANHRGEVGALDGHRLYTQLKIASWLGLFLGHFGVAEEHWQLAGHLMGKSDRIRESVAETLRRAAERENENRGRMEARRSRIVADAAEQEQLRKTENRIMSVLREHKAWMAHGALRQRLSSAQRDCFPEAIDRLLKEELVASRSTAPGHGTTGTEYRAGK